MNNIYVKTYKDLDINYKEILRYAGIKTSTEQMDSIINSCIDELNGKLHYKVCYSEFPITIMDNTINLGFATTTSTNLSDNLSNCKSIVVFAATIGIEIDRLIKRYSSITPSRAVILQAIGAERIESLCNAFNRDITNEKQNLGFNTKPRFSPGYGDLDINLQRDILDCLKSPKMVGISLTNNLFMTPTKSVTAIIGISDEIS